eukprot:TRINITY_DN22385_c0_g1_i1.p1 TRINITY_DN22385_c0_g1~~TRINITY_DN22385_c0_g1_i1.p1  ORF type:complete len:472 (+),score=116.72 TRINITY_DN22385_c0_g1_i1:83-1498(+)
MVFGWLWPDDSEPAFTDDEACDLKNHRKLGQDWWDAPRARRVQWVQWKKRASVCVHCSPNATGVRCKFEEKRIRCQFLDGEGGKKYLVDLPLLHSVNPDKCAWNRKSPSTIELRLIKKKGSLMQWEHLVDIPVRVTKIWLSYDWEAHTEEDDEEQAKVNQFKRERERAQDQIHDLDKKLRENGDPLSNFIGREPHIDENKSITPLERYLDNSARHRVRRRCRRKLLPGAGGDASCPTGGAMSPDAAAPEQRVCLSSFSHCGAARSGAARVVSGAAVGSGACTPAAYSACGRRLAPPASVAVGPGDPGLQDEPECGGAERVLSTLREAGIELPVHTLPDDVVDVPEAGGDESGESDGDEVIIQVNRRRRSTSPGAGAAAPCAPAPDSPPPPEPAPPSAPPAAAPPPPAGSPPGASPHPADPDALLHEAVAELGPPAEGPRVPAATGVYCPGNGDEALLDEAIGELLGSAEAP